MSRRIAVAAALLLQLLGRSLAAQDAQGLDGEAYLRLRRALAAMDLGNDDLYGSLLTESGQLEEAEEELNKAVTAAKSLGGRYGYSIDSHFGDLRFRQHRYDEARAHYRKALDGFSGAPLIVLGDLQMIEARIYNCLARLEIIAGRRDEAKRWSDKALEVDRSTQRLPDTDAGLKDALKVAEAMNDVPRQAAIEAGLGNLQMTNRRYGSAVSHFERSLELFRSSKAPSLAETYTWGDLCLVYIQMGNDAVAENVSTLARQRIGGKSELGDDMLAFIETLLRFRRRQATPAQFKASVERYIRHVPAEAGEAARDVQRMLDYAATVYETNDFPRAELPAHDTTLGATLHLAEGAQELQKGNLAGARRIWRNALAKNPGDTDRASFLLMIGLSYFQERDVEQASRWLAEGTAIQEAGIDDLRSEEMVMKYVGDQGVYYNALIESLAFGGKIEQSFEAAERARARAFLRNRRLKPPTGSRLAVVQQAEKLRRQIDNWDREPQTTTTLAELRQQYEALLPRVQVVVGESESLTRVPAQQIDAVRQALPEDTTLLSYFVTPFGVHAWILDKEKLEHVRLVVSESAMRRISCWAFELASPRGVRTPDRKRCGTGSAAAYAALIAPLRSKIRQKRLMIVPHGELHYVPFAALYDEKRSKYLVEDYPITYVPSASTIRFLREKDSPVGGGALVLGDPVTASQPRLRGAGREAQTVAGKLHTTAILGEAAQESLLYRLDGKIDLLHIAAHGTYDATSPLFSAIHLAEGHGENGQLNVDEIQSKLDLSGVNLVVLSACRSGFGNPGGGDEIIGLTRSILYAGSPGVIATLWDISDEATPPLIDKFYDHLLAGATAADALRAAQVEMLRDPDLRDPRFWAAFFLTGDPQGRWSGQRAAMR
jgi:CHAT domain-containing protein/Flp pilus assembly protein TadD